MTRRPVDDETRSLGKGPKAIARPATGDTTAPSDPTAADDDARLPPQTLLGGRYQVVDLIGRGGMGAVYLAMDEALAGRPVALKVVRRAATGDVADAGLDELRREVLLAQQVTHRNVCRIFDLERIDGRWMIKMEWVDGQLFFGGDFDRTGAAFYVYEEPHLERVDVATGAVTRLFEAAVFGATVSPDGATIYTTEAVGRSRRHLLTNFADRTRP